MYISDFSPFRLPAFPADESPSVEMGIPSGADDPVSRRNIPWFAPVDNNSPVLKSPLEEPKIDEPRIITDADLWSKRHDSDGNESTWPPRSYDIKQDGIGDCYLLASLGALADQQPDSIRRAIRYDAATQTFHVTLHRLDSGFLWIDREVKTVTIEVTQADLQDNLRRGGGSRLDNNPANTRVGAWVAVMETAIVKTHDENWSDGLDEGYYDVVGTNGNHLSWSDAYINKSEVMFLVTGKREHRISGQCPFNYSYYGTDVPPPKWFIDDLYNQVDGALKRGAAVTMGTDPERATYVDMREAREPEQDFLRDNHQYVVKEIKKDEHGKVLLTLFDPHHDNRNVDGQVGSSTSEVTVEMDKLVRLGSLEKFHISGTP